MAVVPHVQGDNLATGVGQQVQGVVYGMPDGELFRTGSPGTERMSDYKVKIPLRHAINRKLHHQSEQIARLTVERDEARDLAYILFSEFYEGHDEDFRKAIDEHPWLADPPMASDQEDADGTA